jgi:PatG C-terminal
MNNEDLNSNKNDTISKQNISTDSNTNTMLIQPQDEMEKSCGCRAKEQNHVTMNNPNYVYAIGNVSIRFPNMSIEKELWQASGRKSDDIKSLAQPEVFNKILTDPNNKYIARQLCWILEIEKLPTYILIPRDAADIERFVNTLRPSPASDDLDVVIGTRGPIAGPEMCNGLSLPLVIVDQIYSFDREELIKAIPKAKGSNDTQFIKTADALFQYIMQMADNVGSTDEHRALNYLSVRYDQIYIRTQIMQDRNFSLSGIEVRLSRLSGTRKIVDVILTYEDRSSAATEKWFTRVDVTEEFPFLVTPLQQFFET